MEDVCAVGNRPRVSTGRAHRALILARGSGTRMSAPHAGATLNAEQLAAAARGQKAFMPVAGRPFVHHLRERLHNAGIDDICVVVGPGQADSEFLSVVQLNPWGTADAVLAAREWAGTEPFLVMNGDNLYPAAAIDAVAGASGPALAGFDRNDLVATGNIAPERVKAFAVIESDAAAELSRIVEKPSDQDLADLPSPILVSMNLWKFDARIFDACRDVHQSSRGEFELPAAVMLARARGVIFKVVPSSGPVLDLSRRGDVADIERRLGVTS
jgi:dTDP-glucose pyrophosphorylase